MQIYTNRFTFAVNQESTELILNFFQQAPILESLAEDGVKQQEVLTKTELVAELVMNHSCAKNLADAILNALNNVTPNADE